jgi:tetratricopeptide (TPR) repeat protein
LKKYIAFFIALIFSSCHAPEDQQAIALYKEGKYSEVISLLDTYLPSHPKDADSFYNRGCAHEKLGNTEKALADYQEAIKNNPTKPEFWMGAANIHYRNQAYSAVVSNMNALIERFPNNDQGYVLKGRAHAQLTQLRQAMDAFDKALEINKRNGEAHLYRGWIEVSAGAKNTGCNSMREAKRLNTPGADEYIQKYCK